MNADYWFGRRPNKDLDTKRAWGARATYALRFNQILGDYAVEVQVFGDRQSYAGFDADGPADLAFVAWINDTAMPKVKKMLLDGFIEPDSIEAVTFDSGNRHIEASPQKSHGYLYIGAWEV